MISASKRSRPSPQTTRPLGPAKDQSGVKIAQNDLRDFHSRYPFSSSSVLIVYVRNSIFCHWYLSEINTRRSGGISIFPQSVSITWGHPFLPNLFGHNKRCTHTLRTIIIKLRKFSSTAMRSEQEPLTK
jgi:hypothetical protein